MRPRSDGGVAREEAVLGHGLRVRHRISVVTDLVDGGRAHAGADAHGHDAVAACAAAALELVDQRRRQARARAAQRVAQRDCSAVRVHLRTQQELFKISLVVGASRCALKNL